METNEIEIELISEPDPESTTARTTVMATTDTTGAPSTTEPTATTAKPVPETTSEMNSEEVNLEMIREKLQFLESRMGLDAEVLVALNRTLREPQTRQKVYQLFLNLVTKLEERELSEMSMTTTTTAASSMPTLETAPGESTGVEGFFQTSRFN